MTLGRGLQSLIPPRDDSDKNNRESGVHKHEQRVLPPKDTSIASSAVVPAMPPKNERQQTDGASHTQQLPPVPASQPASDHREIASRIEALPEPAKYHEPIFHIETSKIVRNPFQPRQFYDEEQLKELAASIREYGILQPIVVTRIERQTHEGARVEYELIAGERRLLASRLIGLERVPAIIKARPRQDREKLEMALIENVQRANLNPLESARAYAKLQDEFGLSQREIAQRLGKSREAIANTIRLLQLPKEAQEALSEGKINESHARIMLGTTDLATQKMLLSEILSRGLSVRGAQAVLEGRPPISTPHALAYRPDSDPQLEHIKNQLEEALGTRVKLTRHGKKGKITINFFSEEELQNIIAKFIREM